MVIYHDGTIYKKITEKTNKSKFRMIHGSRIPYYQGSLLLIFSLHLCPLKDSKKQIQISNDRCCILLLEQTYFLGDDLYTTYLYHLSKIQNVPISYISSMDVSTSSTYRVGHPKSIPFTQWLFLVPLIGGRYHIITQMAIPKCYISGIYCQLRDYVVPTTY